MFLYNNRILKLKLENIDHQAATPITNLGKRHCLKWYNVFSLLYFFQEFWQRFMAASILKK